MPIFISPTTSAFEHLSAAGIHVRPAEEAGQNALHIQLVNQMPREVKPNTNAQWGRLLEASGRPIHLTVISPAEYRGNIRPDGLIVTGAPLEKQPLERISTWPKLEKIFKSDVPSFFVCWAAVRALHHDHPVIQISLNEHKLWGVCPQTLRGTAKSRFATLLHLDLEDFDKFEIPVSRFCLIRQQDVVKTAGEVETILYSLNSGPSLLCSSDGNRVYSLNHPEYDRNTLDLEYTRDVNAGSNSEPPNNYDRANLQEPPAWRPVAQAIVNRWLTHVAELRAHEKPARHKGPIGSAITAQP